MVALGLVDTLIGVARWTWAGFKLLVVLSPVWVPAALIAKATGDNASADTVPVIRTVDGDTIIATVNRTDERIRVLGINSPESVKPNAPVECFGPQASTSAKTWVRRHPRVILRTDRAAPDRDRYGRLLRYVEPTGGGRDLSTVQVAGGYARVAAYGQKLTKLDGLNAAQRIARRHDRGLWGRCN
jgi:micrococcal nuclease